MKELKIILLLIAHSLLIAMPASASEPTPAADLAREGAKYCTTPLQILFDIDKDGIRDEYRDKVRQIGAFMHTSPAATATIVGHADDMEFAPWQTQKVINYLTNMQLSQMRAERVANFLVTMFGIDRARFTVTWYGATQNENRSESLDGRAENRRVNVILNCVPNN